MSDTNLNLYKIFCTVVETQNYKEASKKLFLTEPTISSHIKNLEQQLGITLFFREREGLVLTKPGRELYDSMCDKIRELEVAENTIIQNYDVSKARISIGCPSHISKFYLAKCISKAKRDYPNWKIDLVGASDYNGLLQLLQKHIIDFAIIDIVPKENRNELKTKALKEVHNIFISHIPLKIENVKELENYKYILNYENSASTKELFEVLNEHNVHLQADIHADITEMRIEETKQGLGIGYVMKEAAEEELKKEEVYEVDLPIELPEIKIHLVYVEKYLTNVDKTFIKKYLKD